LRQKNDAENNVLPHSGKNMTSTTKLFVRSALILLSLFITLPCHADNVYKCRTSQGKLEYSGSPCAAQKQAVSSWGAAIDPDHPQPLPMIIKAQGGGHFFVDGKVNGHQLRFLIDTGATTVSLPASMQKNAKLVCKQDVMVDTANGKSKNCVTTIAELRFGDYTIKNIVATLAPNLTQPLLGMNVLSRYRIEQSKQEMRIYEIR